MYRRTCRTLSAVILLGVLWLPVAAWATPAHRAGAGGRLPRSVPSPIQAPIELLRSLWAAISSSPSQLTTATQSAATQEKPVTIDEGAGLDPHGGPKK